MPENTAVAVVDKPDAPLVWGGREELTALANRFKTMLPGAQDFTNAECMMAAQYCQITGLNPYRGEVYFYKDRGKITIVDGYKSITRWAQDKAPYSDTYEKMELGEGELHHVRCWILRDDSKQNVRDFQEMGATFREAFEMAARRADGVITESDTKTKKGGKKDPPTGWTWEMVAEKRALKNCLNKSHGAPDLHELAKRSWEVNGTTTTLEDWESAERTSKGHKHMLPEHAMMNARSRENKAKWDLMTEEERHEATKDTNDMLFGTDPGPTWAEEVSAPADVDTDTGEILDGEIVDTGPPSDFDIMDWDGFKLEVAALGLPEKEASAELKAKFTDKWNKVAKSKLYAHLVQFKAAQARADKDAAGE